MATVAKSSRSTTITLASATAGPFDLDFRLFDSDTLDVFVNYLPRTDWTLNATFVDGYTDSAAITFDAALADGDVIVINGELYPDRPDDYLNSGGLIGKLNIELARLWSAASEQYRNNRRSLRFFQSVSPVALEANKAIVGNPSGDGVVMGPTADEIAAAQGYAQAASGFADAAADSADEIKNLNADAVTLSAGASATASYNPVTGVLTLGVPRGDTGAQGPQGVQGIQGPAGTGINPKGSVATSTALPGWPNSYVGADGDAYITSDTGNMWVWASPDWVDFGQIQGPEGPQGVQGPAGADWPDAPADGLAYGRRNNAYHQVVSADGDTMTDWLNVHYQVDTAEGARINLGKSRPTAGPRLGDEIGAIYGRSIDPANGSSIRSRPLVSSIATENHDHALVRVGAKGVASYVPLGTAGSEGALEWDEFGVRGRANGSTVFQQLVDTARGWGADPANTPAQNDAVFALMATHLGSRFIDLEMLAYPCTVIPALPGARHGYWKVQDWDEGLDALLPAPGTVNRQGWALTGGKTTLSWVQGSADSYNGHPRIGFIPAIGHDPGGLDYSIVTLTQDGMGVLREENRVDFDQFGYEIEVFSKLIVPPSTVGGAYDGAFELYLVDQKDPVTPANNKVALHRRQLAEYAQSGTGGLAQSEVWWPEVTFGGSSFSVALRAAVDAAYSVTTSGQPTVLQSMSLYGANDGSGYPGGNGDFFFTFHGLSGAPTGPYVGYVNGRPKDGGGAISWVGRIGNLTEGVEPDVTWYKTGGSSRLLCTIRSQGSGYPIRVATIGSLNQAAAEGATVQDCPFGNDFATYSPINGVMRPRRKGATSGYLATWETLDGGSEEEFHFVFTGRRTRDGNPGDVFLYRGWVTKGSGEFEDFWTRANIVCEKQLYFANSNSVDTSNQVGVGGCCFIDCNTLLITVSNEHGAVAGDHDEAYLEFIVHKFEDDYADNAEEARWDDGATLIKSYVRSEEWRGYEGRRVTYGERQTATISGGAIAYKATNTGLVPESGSVDTLDTIHGGRDGDIVNLATVSSSNEITLSEAGNLILDTTGTFVLDNARDEVVLKFSAGSGKWHLQTQSDNAT